jgi:heme/copper-type cytochrome/quinol oxidase subunit 3
MWVLILSEMLVFSAFFALYAAERVAATALFDASQRELDPLMSGLNTLVLLTSGLCVALAVEAVSAERIRRARQWLGAAMALGVLFGLALLALVTWHTSTENVETAAAFWHMVDLIWALLMALTVLSMVSARLDQDDWQALPLWSAGLVVVATGFKAQRLLMVYLKVPTDATDPHPLIPVADPGTKCR